MVGKIRGHVSEIKAQASAESRQRLEAEQAPSNTFLSKNDVQGEWDASRVLFTTLGGKLRTLNANDLAAFRHNMQLAQKNFSGSGITPRQVLDLASSKPLKYRNPAKEGAISDLDKAKREIKTALAVSANNNEVRFITSASPGSDVRRHHVTVKLNALDQAATRLAAVPATDTKTLKQTARWLRSQKVSFDCDCKRHRYFFRYVATLGGFAMGRQERAYPKITNPGLQGVACKHVLRAMNELDSSMVVLGFIENLLKKIQKSNSSRASFQISQKEAEQQAAKKTRAIMTTEDRKIAAAKKREQRAITASAKNAPRLADHQAKLTRTYESKLKSGEITTADLIALLARNNINPGAS